MFSSVRAMVLSVVFAIVFGLPHATWSMDVGRFFALSTPPTTSEWLFVFETLIYSDDPQSAAWADATICLNAGDGVAGALEDLYRDPQMESRRERICRPFSGFWRQDAVEFAIGIVEGKGYPPDEPILLSAARSGLRHRPAETCSAILRTLDWWGELPNENDMDAWRGTALLNLLLETPANSEARVFVEALAEGDSRSGARLGAACGLYAIRETLDPEILTDIENAVEKEHNPMIKECLLKTLADRGGRPEDSQRR